MSNTQQQPTDSASAGFLSRAPRTGEDRGEGSASHSSTCSPSTAWTGNVQLTSNVEQQPNDSASSSFLSRAPRTGEDRGEGSASHPLLPAPDLAKARASTSSRFASPQRPDIERQYPLDLSAKLRREQSPPEGIVWSRLRGRKLGGLKFRRQHPIGPYFADFCCVEAMLIIEIDGTHHANTRGHDRTRDAWLRDNGYHILRFSAHLIPSFLEGVLEQILLHAAQRIGAEKESVEQSHKTQSPHPTPLPPAGEGARI